MKAKELLKRYRKGERDFRGVDLSGESLRGINLSGVDLSGANLNSTALQGTKFVNAKLISTQLVGTRTGRQKRWMISTFLLLILLTSVAVNLLGWMVLLDVVAIVQPVDDVFGFANKVTERGAGTVGLFIVAVPLIIEYRRGMLFSLGVFALFGTLAYFTLGSVELGYASALTVASASASAATISISVSFAFTSTLNFAGSLYFYISFFLSVLLTIGASRHFFKAILRTELGD